MTKYDDFTIKLAISLDPESKSAQFLKALLYAYDGLEWHVEDPLVARCVKVQLERYREKKELQAKRRKQALVAKG